MHETIWADSRDITDIDDCYFSHTLDCRSPGFSEMKFGVV